MRLDKINKKPGPLDVLFLSIFVIFITFQPYLLHHEIILLDQGLQLPAISAIFRGEIPYKDIMYYRGPFELYAPAFMMMLFGDNMIWLPVFFYVGTIITLLIAVFIAAGLYRTRLLLYLMVPVFVARTFPRVSFYYWGGMRYALGLLGVFFAISYFKSKKRIWIFSAGVASAVGLFTTIESGVSTIVTIACGLMAALLFKALDRGSVIKAFKYYAGGFLLIFIPYVLYLWKTESLIPFLEATVLFPIRMGSTYLEVGKYIPGSFWEFLLALVPNSKYFKFMTPVYFYAVFLGYFVYRIRRCRLDIQMVSLVSVAIYGLILYVASFRAIWGHHFEMALQPEKILFFFILEEAYLLILSRRSHWMEKIREGTSDVRILHNERLKVYATSFLIFALVMSSLGYSFSRYSKRFTMFKLFINKISGQEEKDFSLLSGREKKALTIKRARGMVVPAWQADDIEEAVRFIEQNTEPQDYVFTYPELGNFNYWANRPFVGRFAIATLSWADERWHKEFVSDFLETKPEYAIMTNLGHRTFPAMLYFKFPKNIRKFEEVTNLVLENYKPIRKLSSITIYKRIR